MTMLVRTTSANSNGGTAAAPAAGQIVDAAVKLGLIRQ
jgi:hypothetical protein